MKLTSAHDAIKQAYPNQLVMYSPSHPNTETYLVMPEFWQALGKARGWDEGHKRDGHLCLQCERENWRGIALCYFETRLSGGDEKKFWESLP
jgi:hypothetical protein